MPWVLLTSALLTGACQRAAPGAGSTDLVVARWDGLAVHAGELAQAVAALPDAPSVRSDRPRLQSVITDILVDEALAREARATIPGAGARARAAARDAAVRLLLEPHARTRPPLEAYYREHVHEYRIPAQVHLAEIVGRDCTEAAKARAEVENGALSFAAAALRYSVDRPGAVRGGDTGWRRQDELPEAVRRAVERLTGPGDLTEPVKHDGRCVLLRLVERRPARTRPLSEVRPEVETRVAAAALGAARREHVQKLGGAAQVLVRDAALKAALATGGDLLPDEVVMVAGSERLTAGEVRWLRGETRAFGPGGQGAFVTRLREDLLLWQEARRLGLDRRPEVRGAERAALVGALAEHLRSVVPASLPEADVRTVYEKSQGDYTEPQRVRVSALVTRDEKKAERWVRTLRAERFRADAFEKLLAESEDEAAKHRGGDLGWIDERSTHVPDSFKRAALLLPRPGEVSGVVQAGGAYHVLLCRDLAPQRVKPFAEVAAGIRSELQERRRREEHAAKVESVRKNVRPSIDWDAIRALDWKAR